MNVKKYAQNKVKKTRNEKHLQNKENLQYYENKISIDESKFKQFSVDLHKFSQHQDKKNIIKEDISICLSPQSQYKNFGLLNQNQEQIQKPQNNTIMEQVYKFTKKLENNSKTNTQDFKQQLNEQIKLVKNSELRNMLLKIIQKCNFERNQFLNNQIYKSAINQRQRDLKKKLQELLEINKQLKAIKEMENTQKSYIKNTLKSIYQKQLKELNQLEKQEKKYTHLFY